MIHYPLLIITLPLRLLPRNKLNSLGFSIHYNMSRNQRNTHMDTKFTHVIAQKDVIYRQIQNNAIKYSYWGKQVCHNKSSLNEKQFTTYFQVHVN